MNLFISWSGQISKEIAEALTNWIPTVLQSVKPYFSPADIEKGAKWESEITKKLNESSIGIICVTTENTEKPWILFEAGALSNKLEKSRVCPLLFELTNSDLTGPLATFQTTVFNKTEFKKLMSTVNKQLDDKKISDTIFNEVFDTFFPKLEEKINKIIEKSKKIDSKKTIERTDREILEEVLELTRRQYIKPKRSFIYDEDYDIDKSFEKITKAERKQVEKEIMNYMLENKMRLKEYSQIDEEDVVDFLRDDMEIRKACGSPENLRRLIVEFRDQ